MADEAFPDSYRSELGDVSKELDRIGTLADGVARTNCLHGESTEEPGG